MKRFILKVRRELIVKPWLARGFVSLLLFTVGRTVVAQGWPTFGHDPQRSGQSSGTLLSSENVSRLELKWATQLENVPLALNSLMAPVVADNVTTSAGARTVVYVAGSSDTFFALDAHDGKVLWNRTFDSAVLPEDESFCLCPTAVNATPTIDRASNLVETSARDGKLYGHYLV